MKKNMQWNDWLKIAKEYQRSYGNLLVPSRYLTPDGYRLGRWIERQRAKYNGNCKIKGALSQDQIEALDSIGMVWKLGNRCKWNEWLEFCDEYLKSNGDLIVSKDYMIGDICLGNWIVEQRKKYHAGKLTECQINDLNKRKMIWSLGERRAWDDWFTDAKEYYECHGDLLVPLTYMTDDGYRLGQWISSQRSARKKAKNYPKERICKLDSISMVWNSQDVRDDAWERMYFYIETYKKEHGRLPLWPKGQLAPDGRTMDGWINSQRAKYNAGRLTESQVQKLNDIGIIDC